MMLLNSMSLQAPLRSIEADGFVLTERLHPPHWTLHPHAHETTIIGLIFKGCFTESVGKTVTECRPHSLQILPAGEQHSYSFAQTRVHCLTVDVKPQKLQRIRLFSDVLERPAHFRGEILSALTIQLYNELQAGDITSTLTIEGLILETLGAAGRQHARSVLSVQPRWLRRVKDHIHADFAARVSLTDLAALVEVHPAHLARMFRKHFNSSVGDYVRRLRLDYAAQELVATDKPLAEIATAAGFYDQSHFVHAFKLRIKMTPTAYRAAARGKQR